MRFDTDTYNAKSWGVDRKEGRWVVSIDTKEIDTKEILSYD